MASTVPSTLHPLSTFERAAWLRSSTILAITNLFLLGTARAQVAELPHTAAGRCAAAYFDAFNSGGDDTLRAFVRQYRSPAFLERHPVEERVARFEQLRTMFGRLNPVRVSLSLDAQVTVLVGAADADRVLVLRFQMDTANVRYLAHVTISGIDNAEVPDEYVLYVANRAAPIDEALRANTVRSAATALRDSYVYPELGTQMADALLRNHAEGRYEDLTRAGRLADRITEDARAIANDLHLWVEAQNPLAQASTDPVNRTVEELRRDNFDFREATVLPENIGYVKFDMIHDDEEAVAITAAALGVVSDCDVLIFDLRDNIGGEWGTARLILGYLLPAGTVLGYEYDREGRRVGESTIDVSVPGVPFSPDLPIYVLTSHRTGSAAEALAYQLKHSRRATVVGEVTAGAAHRSEEVVLNAIFRMSVPFMRTENVVTGTDWEGTGVIPQIEVAADRALEAAIEDARRRNTTGGGRGSKR